MASVEKSRYRRVLSLWQFMPSARNAFLILLREAQKSKDLRHG